jgi:hypothetical protein
MWELRVPALPEREGGQFEFGNQASISSHGKLLVSRNDANERCVP